MTNAALIAILAEYDPQMAEYWAPTGEDDGVSVQLTEDDCPGWVICDGYGEFHVTRTHGWYEQTGEADKDGDLIGLMRAMDAAAKALNDTMNEWHRSDR